MARNQPATRCATRVKKSVTEYGDKVGADDKAKIEAALKDAEELLKQIDAQGAARSQGGGLAKTSQKLGETMYAQAQAAAGAAGVVPAARKRPARREGSTPRRRSSMPSSRKSRKASNVLDIPICLRGNACAIAAVARGT